MLPEELLAHLNNCLQHMHVCRVVLTGKYIATFIANYINYKTNWENHTYNISFDFVDKDKKYISMEPEESFVITDISEILHTTKGNTRASKLTKDISEDALILQFTFKHIDGCYTYMIVIFQPLG